MRTTSGIVGRAVTSGVAAVVAAVAPTVAIAGAPSDPVDRIVAPTASLTVAYTSRPPLLDVEPYAEVVFEYPPGLAEVAVLPDGGAVVVDDSNDVAYLVGRDGSTSPAIPLSVPVRRVVATDGPVVYGVSPDASAESATMSAVVLTGPNAGGVVASTPIANLQNYRDLPVAAFGNTPAGVVDLVRAPGTVLIEHVDADGRPTTVSGLRQPLTISADGLVVDEANPAGQWQLAIERHPDALAPPTGESPPTPSADGSSVYWTTIGPLVFPDDDRSGSMTVIGVLQADGSGAWYAIPAGWSVASSDVGGTLLVRQTGRRVELARLAEAVSGGADESGDAACPDYVPADAFPIRLCDWGESVRAAQIRLAAVDPELRADGYFGPRTEAAVRVFQQTNALEVDGLIGPDTWGLISPSIAIGVDADADGAVEPWEITDVVLRQYYWAVVVAGAAEFEDPTLTEAAAAVTAAGYPASPNGCQFGAAEALGDPTASVFVAVRTETEAEAQTVRTALAAESIDGVVAQLYTTCLD